MNWQPWVLLAHIAGAVVWVGGGVALSLIGVRVRKSGDLAVTNEFARTLSYLGLRMFMPAVVVVLLSGIGLVLLGFSGDFAKLWIVLALGGFVLAFLIGAVYLSRSAIRLERLATNGDLAGARAALGSWLAGYTVVLVILVLTLWDMVFKPGS